MSSKKSSMAHKLASFSKGFQQGRAAGRHIVRAAGLASLGIIAVGAAHKAFGAARASSGNSTHLSRYHAMMKKHKK